VKWTEHVTRIWTKRKALSLLERKPEERSQYEDNIKVDVREIGGAVLIGFIWLRIGTSGWLL
jgi:hypothetical protein